MILRKNVTCSTNYKFDFKKSNFIKPVASQAAASSKRRVYLDTNITFHSVDDVILMFPGSWLLSFVRK